MLLSKHLVKGSSQSIWCLQRNAGMASRPGVWELFILISNFLNLWILKSLKVIGSSSEILLLKGVSFSKLNVFDFEVHSRFLKCWKHSQSFSSLFAPFNQAGGTHFLLLISLIVLHEFLNCLSWYSFCKDLFLGGTPTSIFQFFCPSICPSICCTPSLRNCTPYDHNFCYTCVKWWYSLACSISQEPYVIWSSFMVHMCNISPGTFFIFSKFWFSRLWGR